MTVKKNISTNQISRRMLQRNMGIFIENNQIPQVGSSLPTLTLNASDATTLSNGVRIAPRDSGINNDKYSYSSNKLELSGPSFPQYYFISPKASYFSSGSLSNAGMTIEFAVDCQQFELYQYMNGAKFAMWVDEGSGWYLVTNPFITKEYNNGSIRTRNVLFADKRIRKIRIFEEQGFWGGIFLNKEDSLISTDYDALPRMLFIGTSITEGGSSGYYGNAYPENVCRLLNVKCVNRGSGSTGYLANSGGSKYTYREHIGYDLSTEEPEYLIIEGGINDSSYVVQDVVYEAELTWNYCLQNYPNTKLIIIGVYWPSGSPIQNAKDINDALKAKALEIGIDFIDIINGKTVRSDGELVTDSSAWITGTGRVDNLMADGNADVYTSGDGTHPTYNGHIYLANRIASEIRKILLL